jgi:branched-chain amino acid transport system permease protein
MYSAEFFWQTLIAGVIIGVLYALMALGITFIYSIVKMINWAMGEFYMIASYAQYLLVVYLLGPDLWYVAALLSAAAVFLMGFALEPVLIKPMFRQALERQDEYATVVTISLLLLLRNLAAALAGPYQYKPYSNLPLRVMVGPLPVEGTRVAACLCAVAALAIFYVVLRKTWYGLALRAAAQSRIGVQTAGVDIIRLDQVAFAIGVALAGIGGALLAPVFNVLPTDGAVTTVKGFEIIVIGGLGSIPGALIAGVLLGVVESLGTNFISSPYQNVYGFLLVLLVLLLRPTGLFGEKARQA